MTPEEKRAIKALKTLERIWPSSLWVFCTGGSLAVLRVGSKGERVMNEFGCVDSESVVANFNIPNDGGDW